MRFTGLAVGLAEAISRVLWPGIPSNIIELTFQLRSHFLILISPRYRYDHLCWIEWAMQLLLHFYLLSKFATTNNQPKIVFYWSITVRFALRFVPNGLGSQTLGIKGKIFTDVSRDSTFQIGKSVRFYEKLKIDDAFETMPKRFLMNLNEHELLLSLKYQTDWLNAMKSQGLQKNILKTCENSI